MISKQTPAARRRNLLVAAMRFTPAEIGELNRAVTAIPVRARLPDAVQLYSGVEARSRTES
jgi:hypothetical protein